MASVAVTAQILARNFDYPRGFAQSLTASSGSTDAPNKFAVKFPSADLSNAFLVVYDGSTVINELTVKASSGAQFAGEGKGDYTLEAAATSTFIISSSVRKVYGPFESLRFLDSATGENVMYVTVGSSTLAYCEKFQLGAFQVVPSS
jgi:nitrous oxidase accessory protein NosD